MAYRLFVMNHFVVMHDVAMMDHMAFRLMMRDRVRAMRLRHRHRRQGK
jgi:hypothetical protein